MIARIYQDGMYRDLKLEGIHKNPDSQQMNCTALEYGEVLAKAMEWNIDEGTEVVIDVLTDQGVSVHRLKMFQIGGSYTVTDRVEGTYKPTMKFLPRTEKIPDRYLVLVDAEENLNEFYKMTDLGGGEWGATHGRIGEQQGRRRTTRNVVIPKSYPDYMFYIKLMEKLKKGYRDKSDCHSVRVMKQRSLDASTAGIPDSQVADLMEKLMTYARMVIQENYTISYTDVTEEMIRQAKQALTGMRKSSNIKEFNQHLLELMHIIPRKIDGRGDLGVKRLLAENQNEYAGILTRESELLDIMESQICMVPGGSGKGNNLLEKLGLMISEATSDEIDEVQRQLNDSLKPKLKKVFCVTNIRTQKHFDRYLDRHRDSLGKRPDIRLFWHGSRNANWFSILQKGLLLNPDAVITGKMFGQGVYFAPSAMKSWGYTSARDAYWTGGDSTTAFMALYATAYGKPFEVYNHNGSWSGYSYKRLQTEHSGCSCVHAKADHGMLRNDEVIFYREDQMTIRYICEFAA